MGIQKSELSYISEIRSETSKTSFYHMFPGEGVTGHLFYYFPEETNISYSRRDWEKNLMICNVASLHTCLGRCTASAPMF